MIKRTVTVGNTENYIQSSGLKFRCIWYRCES